MKTPTFSVVIPLYNKASSIKRAIDSVLSQTIQDFEIIIVGGKSSDGGEDRVKEYKDSRILLIQELGEGVSDARNQGVKEARGELIAFLDADDEWLPEFLEIIVRLKSKWPKAGMYGTGYFKKTVYGESTPMSLESELGDHQIQHWFSKKNKFGMIIITSGMVIPKTRYLEIGGFPHGAAQSEDRYIRAKIALDYQIAYSPVPAVIYYLDYATYASRCISEILKDPFAQYVELHKDTLLKRQDYVEICAFCDYQIALISTVNLIKHTETNIIRADIRKIQTKKYTIYKYYLLSVSYLPQIIRTILLKPFSALKE